MKSLFLMTIGLLTLIKVGLAQEANSSPTPSMTAAPTPVAEPDQSPEPAPQAAPVPGPAPQAPSDLLPETSELPAQHSNIPSPFDLIPEGGKIEFPGFPGNKPSAEQQENDKRRFRQIRTIAARNPYALYLFDRAKEMKTDSSRRQYLRAYYLAMCNQMRRLEPKLKTTIDSFEVGMIYRVTQHHMKPTVPPEDLARYRAAKREEEHQP